MNIRLSLRPPVIWGGIFSQFMLMLPNAIPYNIDKIHFDVDDGYKLTSENVFDWVFDQYYDSSFKDILCEHFGIYTHDNMKRGGYLGAIESSPNFGKMQTICSKLIIKQPIRDKVAEYADQIEPGMLGVHVRLGEMNTIHPQYGTATTETYIKRIKEIAPQSIYLASDNEESIKKIKEAIDCKIVVIDGFEREEIENIQVDNVHMNLLYKDYYWQQVFADMLLLAKCERLLCRVSNFTNAAILFSAPYKEIHRL